MMVCDDAHLTVDSYSGCSAPSRLRGERAFVTTDYTEPQIKWTRADLSGSNDPDTGDIYSGLDRFGRVKDNRWYDYGNSVDADRIKYGYDRAGNRIWRNNTVAASLSKAFDELYTYDAIHRLKTMARGVLNTAHSQLTTAAFQECWSLDATGNWDNFRQDDDGCWDLDQTRTANAVNEITNLSETAGPAWVTPAYSRAGNMTTIPKPADPTTSFTATYDAWNRLLKLEEDNDSGGLWPVAEYAYDGAKRRVVVKNYASGTLSETRHVYFTASWQNIEERLGTSPSSTAPDRQFVWGLRYIDDLLLRDRDTNSDGTLDERLYALQDANWNVTAIANPSATIQERYAYAAYGTPQFLDSSFDPAGSSDFDWETLFCGYRWDISSHLCCIRHRYYATTPGVFMQRDIIRHRLMLSLYSYVDNGPQSHTDSLGLIKFLCTSDKECVSGSRRCLNQCDIVNITFTRDGTNPDENKALMGHIFHDATNFSHFLDCIKFPNPGACISGIIAGQAYPKLLEALLGGNPISGGNIWLQYQETKCPLVPCGYYCFFSGKGI